MPETEEGNKAMRARPADDGPAAPRLRRGKGSTVSLTVTEFLLLQALAQRPGFVKSRDQLMDVGL
jgi:DNA-binding response OmpR family regulator